MIMQLDDKILNSADESNVESEIQESSDFMILISSALSRYKSSAGRMNSSNSNNNTSVKLPNIQLLKFSGSPLEWCRFWDLFRTTIHERDDLSSAAKFQYLMLQLEGEAAHLLDGFDNTEAQYHEAVDLLTSTYGKKKVLIQSRLHAIFDMRNPTPNSASMSDFRASFEGHLRALASHGCDIKASGFVFAELLLRKLPLVTRDHLNRTNRVDAWDLDNFRTAIAEEISLLSASEEISPNIKTSFSDTSNNSVRSASFTVTSNKENNILCAFCNGSHFSRSCTEFKTVELRKNRLRELKACYNCLKVGHGVTDCRNNGRCKTCSLKHHSSICTKNSKGNFKNISDKNSDKNNR